MQTLPTGTTVQSFPEVTDEFAESFRRDGFACWTTPYRLTRSPRSMPQPRLSAAATSASSTEVQPPSPAEDVLRKYLCIHQPAQGVRRGARGVAGAADGRGADRGDRAERQGHAVDAVHQARGQAGPGLAPGRVLHPDQGPLADRGVDRARRRHRGERLPVGAARLHRRGVIYPDREQDDPRFDCTTEALRLPVHRRRRRPGRGARGFGGDLQRLSAAPISAEHRPARPPPGAGQPLHERGVAAPLAVRATRSPRRQRTTTATS